MKRNCIDLEVKISPGSDIAAACEDAVDLARRLGISVWFDFNGVHTLARPDDFPADIEHAWRAALESQHPIKVAAANTRLYAESRTSTKGIRNACPNEPTSDCR